MTGMQKTFIFWTGIYLLIQGALLVGFYVVLIMIERKARLRHAQLRSFLDAKRSEQQKRWKVAYGLYEKKQLPGG